MLTDEDGYVYPLDDNQALYYLRQILSGVQFVHQNNMLHLDICGTKISSEMTSIHIIVFILYSIPFS